MGGIPHYLDHIDVTQSAAQNIDRLCFAPNALLNIEFDQLYRPLFDNSERHISIIRALSAKTRGLTRSELIAVLNDFGTATCKVQNHYHVLLGEDIHYYSVLYRYIGKKVHVI